MSALLDERYLSWLHAQVESVKQPHMSQHQVWTLLRQLYQKEFVWLVPNDDNRVADGLALRPEFFAESGLEFEESWSILGCSFLEMLVGLTRRLEFEVGTPAGDWFWELIFNLQLKRMSQARRDEALNIVIWRRYEPDGRGGLFPLKHPTKDQRDVEIWYQLNAYILERG